MEVAAYWSLPARALEPRLGDSEPQLSDRCIERRSNLFRSFARPPYASSFLGSIRSHIWLWTVSFRAEPRFRTAARRTVRLRGPPRPPRVVRVGVRERTATGDKAMFTLTLFRLLSFLYNMCMHLAAHRWAQVGGSTPPDSRRAT